MIDWETLFRGQGASVATAEELAAAARAHAARAGIVTRLRIAHFIGQTGHESQGFTKFTESMNYSVDGLVKGFGRHRISLADAQRLGRKPMEGALSSARQEAIANILYGGEFGRKNLGNNQPGDGWRFRGRSPIGATGRGHYTRLEERLGLPFTHAPELLARPEIGCRAALDWWDQNAMNAVADRDDIEAVTRKVNGGVKGLADRVARTVKAKAQLATTRFAAAA